MLMIQQILGSHELNGQVHKITVRYRTMPDENQKFSDQTKKTPDITVLEVECAHFKHFLSIETT